MRFGLGRGGAVTECAPMSLPDYADYDGLGLADLVRRREVTPVELVQAAIDQIERLNPTLNAVVYTAYDEAQKRAGETLTGPFAGVPFLLKDILGTRRAGRPAKEPDTSTMLARPKIAHW
jgi:amidase